MKIQLIQMLVRTKKSTEIIEFSKTVTFLYGPIGKGKSTVARLIDYCLGGDLERTPAMQHEFVAVELKLALGEFSCSIERGTTDTQDARVSWTDQNGKIGSVSAPFTPQDERLVDAEVYNLSDLIFHLCSVTPIMVRKRSRDPESPLIRLSIRDIWWYCYLDQTHLDSSFYRLEDPFRGRKSQDAMRFFTGLYSERLSQLEGSLFKTLDDQRGKREAVRQIRTFMTQFGWDSDLDLVVELETAKETLGYLQVEKKTLENTRRSETHPTDPLREKLRNFGNEIEEIKTAISESRLTILEQTALRAELITAKTKADRSEQAGKILEGVTYIRCPECGADISDRPHDHDHCRLCSTDKEKNQKMSSSEIEALRRDLNERIDQIADSIQRKEREAARMLRQNLLAEQAKALLDSRLQEELARYDSAFIENIRAVERNIATLIERIKSLHRLQKMPQAINALEEEAGALQGDIDNIRSTLKLERERLNAANGNIVAIEEEFKRILLATSFPGVSVEDRVEINPRNWFPTINHDDQSWGFWDTGSGGKKTLFNVCYALAVHAVALSKNMPVPNILIIDSPTKNISEDKNPELVKALYAEIYRLASGEHGKGVQFLLIDSDLVEPTEKIDGFYDRRMAGEPDAPSLISYYNGP